MKIKTIKLEGFKRFTNLTIELPETARLVVMVGPNGSGKSSVFDALLRTKSQKGRLNRTSPDSYLIKFDLSEKIYQEPEIEFYTESQITQQDVWRKSVHVRSAYRNDAMNTSYTFLSKTNLLIEELRFNRLSENDQAVASNYDRILSLWVERVSARNQSGETADEIEDDLYGELREAIKELFRDPQLTLVGLGSPKDGRIFEFNKETSHGFSYENLSSGEKAALDLLLDIIVAKAEFNDTVFCIDEPEAHIHTKLQGPLLEKLYDLISPNSQLWIATHSIGMVRKAQDLWRDNPDSVVFLDFGKDELGKDLNFDEEVTIKPITPNSNFWAQTYDVALGDMAELVITGRTVFCEGEGFDEECYKNIFKNQYSEIHFTSLGARENVIKSVTAANLAIGKIVKSAKVIGIVDRDKATDGEIERDAEKGIRTLSLKSIESYLLDDEVLTKLCEKHGKQNKIQDLLTAKTDALNNRTSGGKSKSPDDLKPIAQDIHVAAQGIIDSVPLGNNKDSFMKDILAKLIQPGMVVYEELHKDIFGE